MNILNTKVIVKNPVPEVKKGDAFEDTMLLIDMMKQQKEMNNQEKKVLKVLFLDIT